MHACPGKRRRRGAAVTVAAIAVFALVAASAVAAEAPTRDEYVGQLEQTCKPDAEATRRAMKGARSDIQAERFTIAAEKFAAATSIFGGTVREIVPVTRPVGDEAKLSKWFGYLKNQESYLKRITNHLQADRGVAAQRLVARFIHNGNLANNTVLAFGFEFCSFKFSRYG